MWIQFLSEILCFGILLMLQISSTSSTTVTTVIDKSRRSSNDIQSKVEETLASFSPPPTTSTTFDFAMTDLILEEIISSTISVKNTIEPSTSKLLSIRATISTRHKIDDQSDANNVSDDQSDASNISDDQSDPSNVSSDTKTVQSDTSNDEKSSVVAHQKITSPVYSSIQSDPLIHQQARAVSSERQNDNRVVNNTEIKPSSSVYTITIETFTEESEGGSEGVTPPPAMSLNVKFMKELDQLDEYMANISKYVPACARISSLPYCGNLIDYPVPKDLARAPYFQDNMAKAAVETLSILTEGGTTQCEQQIKKVFCHQKFPACDDYKLQLHWKINDTQECMNALEKCSSKAQDTLRKMKICQKLSQGSIDVDECIEPMPPGKDDLCSHGNVSPWLYHSNVEINSLLRFQFSLNEKLTSQCKSSLTKHMCSFGLQCFSQMSVYTTDYLKNVKQSCETTVKSCENQELSEALTQMFLDCQKFI